MQLFYLFFFLLILLPSISVSKKTKEEKNKDLQKILWDGGEAPSWYKRSLEEKPQQEVQLDREHGLLTLSPLERKKIKYSDNEFSLVFLHVPKSGGLALRQALRRLTYPTRLVYRPTWKSFLASPCEKKKEYSFFSSESKTCAEPTLVLGTDNMGACKALNKSQCVYVTILRSPIDVCLSHYEYFCQRGKEGKKLWEWSWRGCGMTVQEWAKKHCENLLVDTLSIDFHNLFNRREFTPKELERIKAKFNVREKIEVAKSNLRNIYVMNYDNGLNIEWARFLRHIGYPEKAPKLNRINHHNNTEELVGQKKIDRNNAQIRSDLEEILWADMQVYEQFLGESMYHLETFVSSAAPISFSLSFLFLSLLLSFFF